MTPRSSGAGSSGAGRAGALVIGVVIILWCVSASAQQPTIAIGTRVGDAPSGYDDGGRRDPFASLIAPKAEPKPAPAPVRHPGVGLAGLSVTDVVVRGVVRGGATVLAILEAPDGKTYLVHARDHLQDGVVKEIDADGVVFVEQLVDASGAHSTRDVRKAIRGSGGSDR